MINLSLEASFDFASSRYAELFANSNATAFQHPVWLETLYRKFTSPGAAEPLVVTASDEDTGELVLVLPVVRRRKHGVAIVEFADFGVTDYCAPVVRNGYHEAFHNFPKLSQRVMELVAPCDIIRVKSVRPEYAKLVEDVVGSPPAPAGFSSHEAPLTAPYSDWRLATFSKSHLRYLDRRRRKFDKLSGARLELLIEPSALLDAIDELSRLRAGRFEGDPIRLDDVREFYAEIALRGSECGFSLTYRLSEGTNTVGIVFGIANRGRFNYLLIGCDYDGYSKYSPGLLMYDMIMADWVDAGGRIFDFTIGDEPFKADFGTRPIQISAFNRAMSITGRVAGTVHSMSKRFA